MTDQEQEPWQEPWPEKMYLLHPSIKTFGAMVSNPERREYVRADRIEELNERLIAATDDAKEAEAYAEELDARNKELTLQLLATHGQAADALDKLTKAVEALRETTQMLSQCTFTIIRIKGQYFDRHEVVDKANAVLAELEGK
jgi:predicted  nucleic acid-binding Zn-ribbon protein